MWDLRLPRSAGRSQVTKKFGKQKSLKHRRDCKYRDRLSDLQTISRQQLLSVHLFVCPLCYAEQEEEEPDKANAHQEAERYHGDYQDI